MCQSELRKDRCRARTVDFRTADDMDDNLGCARATIQEGCVVLQAAEATYLAQRVRHELRCHTQISCSFFLYAMFTLFHLGSRCYYLTSEACYKNGRMQQLPTKGVAAPRRVD